MCQLPHVRVRDIREGLRDAPGQKFLHFGVHRVIVHGSRLVFEGRLLAAPWLVNARALGLLRVLAGVAQILNAKGQVVEHVCRRLGPHRAGVAFLPVRGLHAPPVHLATAGVVALENRSAVQHFPILKPGPSDCLGSAPSIWRVVDVQVAHPVSPFQAVRMRVPRESLLGMLRVHQAAWPRADHFELVLLHHASASLGVTFSGRLSHLIASLLVGGGVVCIVGPVIRGCRWRINVHNPAIALDADRQVALGHARDAELLEDASEDGLEADQVRRDQVRLRASPARHQVPACGDEHAPFLDALLEDRLRILAGRAHHLLLCRLQRRIDAKNAQPPAELVQAAVAVECDATHATLSNCRRRRLLLLFLCFFLLPIRRCGVGGRAGRSFRAAANRLGLARLVRGATRGCAVPVLHHAFHFFVAHFAIGFVWPSIRDLKPVQGLVKPVKPAAVSSLTIAQPAGRQQGVREAAGRAVGVSRKDDERLCGALAERVPLVQDLLQRHESVVALDHLDFLVARIPVEVHVRHQQMLPRLAVLKEADMRNVVAAKRAEVAVVAAHLPVKVHHLLGLEAESLRSPQKRTAVRLGRRPQTPAAVVAVAASEVREVLVHFLEAEQVGVDFPNHFFDERRSKRPSRAVFRGAVRVREDVPARHAHCR
mmetsp:Transcript_8632/g.32483  ORF Transcript_8632/g.32483 Transcript_8632/m.32483 type:complete len:654 (+) Transcript_8632:1120-3081(+)